jgi:tetratricopeptide (TPR) repeat protein
LVLLSPLSAKAAKQSQLHESCFSKEFMYAVPACERIIETTDADYKVHFRLAKMYQDQRHFEKAKTTLERALVLFDAQGDKKRIAETKRFKSNVDEDIWLSGQTRQDTEISELRIKCIRFAKILPQQAINACDQYLATAPNDIDVISSKELAAKALAKKAKPSGKPDQGLVATSRTFNTGAPSTSPLNSSISKEAVIEAGKAAESSVTLKKDNLVDTSAIDESGVDVAMVALPTESSAAASLDAMDKSAIDPKVIEQIKNELNGLYAIIQEQQAASAKMGQPINYSEKGKRYALVVGNADYSRAIGRLKNSVNDALDISNSMKKIKIDIN